MKNYIYRNNLIGKKELRELLSWSFTNYDSIQSCAVADELKYLGFKYASQAGISISIEDLKIPFVKNLMLEKANQEILNSEKLYLKGKITEVERFQKIIDTWSLTSEYLKEQVIYYFKNYDPLNSVYIMAFSGARGNLSQVRQLVGMRGLMADPSGEIMNLPIKKNFREGLTITDYLMSGYGARKGIVDTALKTANSGYLTRRLIDVSQDILIREKDCLTPHSFFLSLESPQSKTNRWFSKHLLGRILSKPIINPVTNEIIVDANTQISPSLIKTFKNYSIKKFYVRSPLTCNLYRAICQKCYGWDLANESLVDIGEAIGILAGQSIGEPGTQLTMRTFHTGGIFTSEARQQIVSPINGIIRFYKGLKTVLVRTNRGEEVLVTKNSGSFILIPELKNKPLKKIKVLRNTILFLKNNQYISKDRIVGELINTNKQIKTEIKPILSDNGGEIFIPRLKQPINTLNNNKLIWILSGQLYNSPRNAFINFYPDYKLNRQSSIFRTKLINHYIGFVKSTNNKIDLYQRLIRIQSKKYEFTCSTLQKLLRPIQRKNYLLCLKSLRYALQIKLKNAKYYLQLSRNQKIGTLISNNFRTLTGGSVYYDSQTLLQCPLINSKIFYIRKKTSYPLISFRTVIWFGEETHRVNCEPSILLVDHGDFISEGFELIPGIFSKTAGIIIIRQKNNLVQSISIRSGSVYKGKKFKNTFKKFYYPGEIILSSISIKQLSFCQSVNNKNSNQLLVRPIEIYEVSQVTNKQVEIQNNLNKSSNIQLELKIAYHYKSKQTIKGTQNLNLIGKNLIYKSKNFFIKDICLSFLNNSKKQTVEFQIDEKVNLINCILPNLRYKNLNSSLLIQQNQFIDCYNTFCYLEAITKNSLEIVKFKVKNKNLKQIFLISNEDCFAIKKTDFPNKKLNDFIVNGKSIIETGKIIIENKNFLTLQKSRPYFFPNCQNKDLRNQANIQYKILSPQRSFNSSKMKQKVSLNYYDVMKFSLKKKMDTQTFVKTRLKIKAEFSKLFLKWNGKFYSSLIPQFLKKFSIKNLDKKQQNKKIFRPEQLSDPISNKLDRTLLLQSSDLLKNKYKWQRNKNSNYQLALVKFLEYPFIKSTKSIGIYSITENYFEQDVNSVFCKNSEFIESGQTLGLLKLEKEITGDIVQGLPRIEEILEARKKNSVLKRIATSQKKGLLVQKSSLDPNFEFKKLATTIKENEKINPHKLLKVYFNYYGLRKSFICDQEKAIISSRLIQNYESSYKSFKQVQVFILNSVQSVYNLQGVTINNKHLEIIIKQMTTKVLITYEGNTPLLRREIIELYHIKYINKIVEIHKKQSAFYVPLLLGITKAALNNPSFISAASFQETTRVLTKAAIEGQMDWLRGLKENIIIGHLIPAGTGSQNYQNCFKKRDKFNLKVTQTMSQI